MKLKAPRILIGLITALITTVLPACGITAPLAVPSFAPQPGVSLPAYSTSQQYEVFAWNELGMHCANPSYDAAVILPPYNVVRAQVVRRGNPPTPVTAGLTVSYNVINNTSTYGKADYGQFWDNAQALFGITLARNTGLNLEDPNIHNGMSGTMVNKGTYFVADGIPISPYFDNGGYNPYQVGHIVVRDSSNRIVAETYLTIPVSDEIDCAKCHGANAFLDVLQKHDAANGTNLVGSQPVLCASCHGDPVLQAPSKPGVVYLSQAIHTFHSTVAPQPDCIDCHPGKVTACSRSIVHTDTMGNCTTCHGDLSTVGGSIATGGRIPWANEPKCSTCHGTAIAEVDTGATLFRNATGHGGIFCSACHGSPHAMLPTTVASDAYQSMQYQKNNLTIADCRTCHNSSLGGSGGPTRMGDFADEHGGTNPSRVTACGVCHTAVSTDTASWPHQFEWKDRSKPPTVIPPAPTTTTTVTPPPTGTTVTFTGTIQPLLNTYCVSCHGGNSPSAGVNLTNYSNVMATVVAGNAGSSLLYRALNGTGVTRMPPGTAMTAAQIASFATWINSGAPNSTGTPVTTTPPPTTTTPPTTGAGGNVSFSATIQPLINASCSCHIGNSSSGGVSLANYTAIRAQVSPGNPSASRLYQCLNGTNGLTRMPPGGSLNSAQIQSVYDWINQGALNTTGTTTPPPSTTTTPPTTTGGVTFSGTIQPLMTNYCSCHTGSSPSAGISLSNYAGVLATVTPGNAAGSRLYQSLNGTNGRIRMPPGGALTSVQIASVATWINAGALNNSGTTTPPPTTTTMPPTTVAGVTFTGTIQPLINANCSCHVSGSSGGVSLNSYAAIVAQVTPGNASNSRLYQSLNGSNGLSRMPPNGALSSSQIASVATWINAGALNNSGTTTPPSTTTTPPTTVSGVSFTGTIQPLINANCSCHVSGSSGGVSLNSYNNIKAQVTPGNATGSRLYQSLLGSNGLTRMPPGGALSSTQIASMATWINAGALNNTSTPPPTTTTPPTTGGTVSFSRDIKPILSASCSSSSCHGGSRPQSGINLTTYAGVRAIVVPGNGTGSQLYRAVTGSNGATRMPPSGRLTASQIQSILNWINQGALNN